MKRTNTIGAPVGLAATAALALVAGCTLAPAEVEPSTPASASFTLVSALPGPDTIGAPVGFLDFEVTDENGQPWPGTAVLLEAARFDNEALLGLAADPAAAHGAASVETTDASGRIRVHVRLGNRTGDAPLTLRSIETDDQAAVVLRVEPGAVTLVDLVLDDTLQVAGDSILPPVDVFDRMGNRITRPPSVSARGGTAIPGGVVGGPLESVVISATLDGVTDSIGVTFVPAGRLAVLSHGDVYRSRLDGSEEVVVTNTGAPSVQTAPLGTAVIYHEANRIRLLLSRFDVRRVTTSAAEAVLSAEADPYFAPDGSRIYFTGTAVSDGAEAIWRVSPLGTDLEQVTTPAPSERHWYPSVSRAGDRIAFGRNAGANHSALWVRDLGSGAETDLGVIGNATRWSPDDQWILYRSPAGELRRIRPDGADDRPILSQPIVLERPFDWSPGGDYIIAMTRRPDELRLIEVATGRMIRLPRPFGVTGVSWFAKPE